MVECTGNNKGYEDNVDFTKYVMDTTMASYKVEELKKQGWMSKWMRVRLVFSESVFRYLEC